MTGDDTTDRLDATLAALDGGPTGLTPSAAGVVIDQWRAACQAEDTLDLSGVAAGLQQLRVQLNGRLDGAALADTLARLADDTAAAAGHVTDARLGPRLDRLAATLRRFADILS